MAGHNGLHIHPSIQYLCVGLHFHMYVQYLCISSAAVTRVYSIQSMRIEVRSLYPLCNGRLYLVRIQIQICPYTCALLSASISIGISVSNVVVLRGRLVERGGLFTLPFLASRSV